MISSNVSSIGGSYIVPGSAYMPINEVEDLLKADNAEHEQELGDAISKYAFSDVKNHEEQYVHRKSVPGLAS